MKYHYYGNETDYHYLTGTFNKKVKKSGKPEEYHQIMKEQLNPGIIESIPKSLTREVVHHIPHQPVIKESAESIKL